MNKAAGFDCLTVEHIIFAHESVVIVLRTLFNIMLHTGLVPDSFGIGKTTPVPKFKGCKRSVSADDFRGITICPVISKLFEHCIKKFIDVPTSVRQFGFKKNVGCENALHSLRKVVNYFNNRKSTINAGVIDLRKAFDKCNTFGILHMLQRKNINSCIINTLENWFSKSSTAVNWFGSMSQYVPLLSGVKQGGVLSPLLFTIFVDTVLDKLELTNRGCFVNFRCYNSFMYADDLILLSISVTDLQYLFKVCSDMFTELDLPINVSKCHCMRIGPRFNICCKPLKIQGNDVNWVNNINYLGVTIVSAKSFKCQWNESRARFYTSVNTILGRLSCNASIDVLLKLIRSQAVPSLLYGISAVTLSNTEIHSFTNAYNNIFYKIFRSFDKNTVSYCQWYCGFWPFELLYDYHRYNFLNRLVVNKLLTCTSAIDNPDYIEYSKIQNKYDIQDSDSIGKIRYNIWKHFENMLPW